MTLTLTLGLTLTLTITLTLGLTLTLTLTITLTLSLTLTLTARGVHKVYRVKDHTVYEHAVLIIGAGRAHWTGLQGLPDTRR